MQGQRSVVIMRNGDMRKELKFGLAFNALALLLQQFTNAPEPVMGFLLGMAICLMLIGILPEKSYQRIKVYKRSMFYGGKQ